MEDNLKQQQSDYHETFQLLLRTVQKEIQDVGINISDDFVVMMVKLAALNPQNKFLIRQQMVQSEIERMKKIVVNRIKSMSQLSRNIISLQFYVKMNYYSRDDSNSAHHEDLDREIGKILGEINQDTPQDIREMEIWHAKLLAATIIEADMGAASDPLVLQETQDALSSIFPKEDINLLRNMPLKDREEELHHLMHIAIGIRLFSKNLGVASKVSNVEDLTMTVPEKIERTMRQISNLRFENIRRLVRYTTLAQPYFLRQLHIRHGRRAVSTQLMTVRTALVLVHQILLYLKDVQEDLTAEKDLSQECISAFRDVMEDLNSTADNSKDLSKSFIYPKFVDLWEAWRDLQDSNVFVESIMRVMQNLEHHSVNDLKEADELASEQLGELSVPTEREFFFFPKLRVPEDKYSQAKRLDFRDDLDPFSMSLRGFCIHSFVKGIGLVVLSNPNFGIFNWKNQNYLLSSAKAVVEFRRNPDTFVKKAYAIVRKWPEFIALLRLENEIFNPATLSDADRSSKLVNVLIGKDIGCQTEVHPIPKHISEHYTWNEWELRERGLTLSKIHKCRTHGTQTHLQAMKQTKEVQTYPLRNALVQTNRSVHSEISQSHFYLYGLRGLHCDLPPHIVELTIEDTANLRGKLPTKVIPPPTLDELLPFEQPHFHKYY